MPILFLIHGFVGSGKTTFAKKLAVEKNAVRFSPDEWMSHFYGSNPSQELFEEYDNRSKTMIWSVATEFLKRGNNVILDYGFWHRSSRDKYRQMAADVKVECVLYALESDYPICKERTLKRTAEMPKGELFIDENALQMFWNKFEAVTPDENAIFVKSSLRA
jgi:predicted kinase